jgi:hypothetical protein
MPSKLFSALKLASLGFFVFPIVPGHKSPPALVGWQEAATRSATDIQAWWEENPDYNIGISTSKFLEGDALLAVDVDNKNGGVGDESLLRLELSGRTLPDTFTQTTPTRGQHLLFRVSTPVRQGTHLLGRNLDIRSDGGYLVGAGSTVESGDYRYIARPVAPAPQWIIDACGAPRGGDAQAGITLPGIDPQRAIDRATWYLQHEAPLAVQGQGGDETTYKVAARCKDLGVSAHACDCAMWLEWNPRCSPPWTAEELSAKVRHAYKYGLEPVGSQAPEAIFATDPTAPAPGMNGTPHPFDTINQQYAFVLAGGGAHILWETTDAAARYRLEHLSLGAFHSKFAPYKMQLGRAEHPVSELWMESKKRREFDGLVFMPEQTAPERFYNLWRGFAYAPAAKYVSHPAVEAFLDHTRQNICGGNETLSRWLVGYFAHLVQRPWEKPLVALVFRGAKGVGKNAPIERVGALLGGHFLLTSNRRYLIGNFNGHLENCLLFTLDEAFWSGDKQAEGTLKDLITGREHVIEHKGKEPYTVSNKTRVVIIGNEEWLVPASYDERRFAVFDVGVGRKQDRQFFTNMRVGMESEGGYAVLLRYLLDHPLSDVNAAPHTTGLRDQKHESLDPVHQWWFECLEEGRIVGTESTTFPHDIHCDRFRAAFRRYAKERNIKARIPEDRAIGRLLKQCAPALGKRRLSVQDDGSQPYHFFFRSLDEHRAEWGVFMQHATEWA